jgi:hypothetical protein
MKIVKRFIDQRFIGYRKNIQGNITHSVYENRVEWKDGTQSTVWMVQSAATFDYHLSELLEECPRIDIAV